MLRFRDKNNEPRSIKVVIAAIIATLLAFTATAYAKLAAEYTPNSNYIPVATPLIGDASINDHTVAYRMWVNTQGQLVFAVKSTHQLQGMTLNGITQTSRDVWPNLDTIIIHDNDPTTTDPELDPSDGFTKATSNAHWTIYTFPLSALDPTGNNVIIQGINNSNQGHTIISAFDIQIPNTTVRLTKTFVGSDPQPVRFELYRRLITQAPGEATKYGADFYEANAGNNYTLNVTVPASDYTGLLYVYTFKEISPQYDVVIGPDTNIGLGFQYAAVNTLITTTHSVTKEWRGEAGVTHDPVSVQLLQNGIEFGTPVLVTDTHQWTGLPLIDPNGAEYTYTVREISPPNGYRVEYSETPRTETTPSSSTITNIPIITYTATKAWEGPIPVGTNITLTLKANGTEVATGVVDGIPDGNLPTTKGEISPWVFIWPNLDKYDVNGNIIDYAVEETSVIANYDSTVTEPDDTSSTITNTYQTVAISAQKNWEGIPTGMQLPKIRLQLTQNNENYGNWIELDGTTETPAWSYTWSNLPERDANDVPYVYNVIELNAPDGFTAGVVPGATEGSYIVTNTYAATSITANKVYTGTLPDGMTWPAVGFDLYRDGVRYDIEPRVTLDGTPGPINPVGSGETVTDATHWHYTWNALPKYRPGTTEEYVYTVVEPVIPQGFTRAVSADGLTITNNYEGDTITAQKYWEGGTEPRFATFQLYQINADADDGYKQPFSGQVTLDGDVNMNPDGSGELSPWTYTWVDLVASGPGLTAETINYKYIVEEVDASPDYFIDTESSASLHVTNVYELTQFDITKQWIGGDNLNASATFTLYRTVDNAAPTPVPGIDPIVLNNADPTAAYTWIGLDKYDFTNWDGTGVPLEYTYSVVESNVTENFISAVSEDGKTFINTYQSPRISKTGTKIWLDGIQTGQPQVTLNLWRSIEGQATPSFVASGVVDGTIDTTVDENNTPYGELDPWSYTWLNLDETDGSGNLYTYTVTEAYAPTNYEGTAEGLVVSNQYVIPYDKSVQFTKQWKDGPSEHPTVWFKLYRTANGVTQPVPDNEFTLIDESMPIELPNGSTVASWEGLARTDIGGNEYTYSVVEGQVDETGVFTAGPPLNYSMSEINNGSTILNSYVIPKNGVALATKTWEGGSALTKPTIWLQLMRHTESNQTPVPVPNQLPIELVDGELTANWTGLEETDISGSKYIFTVLEGTYDEVNGVFTEGYPTGYTGTYNNLNVTNKYNIPIGDVTATKIWEFGSDPRPIVYFDLYCSIDNGVTLQKVKETFPGEQRKMLDGITSVTWTGIDQSDFEGNPYTFFVKEVDSAGNDFTPLSYDKNEDHLTVTNTYRIPTAGTYAASKDWQNLPEGFIRPPVKFQLYRSIEGVDVRESVGTAVELDGITNTGTSGELTPWTWTWTGLEETDINQNTYIYSVDEDEVPGNFEKEVRGSTVVNRYQTVDITGYKEWANNPEETPRITLQLKQNGTVIAEQELQPGLTQYTWYNLPKANSSNALYTYTVDEKETPAGFTKSLSDDGLTVTNTYVPTSFSVQKIYANTPENGYIPPVWIQLYQNGDAFGDLVELDGVVDEQKFDKAGNPYGELSSWVYTWTNLPKIDETGADYTYTALEPTPPDDYVESIDENGNIVNTYRAGVFSVTKTWDDNNIGTRPEVQLELYQTIVGQTEDTQNRHYVKIEPTVTLDGVVDDPLPTTVDGIPYGEYEPWKYRWVDLAGNDPTDPTIEYAYEIVEIPLSDDYKIDTVTSSSTNITNVYQLTSFEATKQWSGGENIARQPVKLQLYNGTQPVGDAVTLDGIVDNAQPDAHGNTSGELSEWKYTWASLPRYHSDGVTEIIYHFQESTGATDFTASYPETGVVLNTYAPPQYDTVNAEKAWSGGPTSGQPQVQLQLSRSITGGTAENFPVVTLDGNPDAPSTTGTGELTPWVYIWTKLDKTDQQGNTYTYSVAEVNALSQYEHGVVTGNVIDGFTITNAFKETTVPFVKEWIGGGPDWPNATIRLMVGNGPAVHSDGSEVQPIVITNGGTSGEFINLPLVDADGNTIVYTLVEDNMDDFTTSYDQANRKVINTYNVPSIEKTVEEATLGSAAAGETLVLDAKTKEFTYNVSMTVAPDIADYASLKLSDTLDPQLTINAVTVEVDGALNTTLSPVVDNANNSVTLEITSGFEAYKGKTITLLIDAQINSEADLADYIDYSIPNTATLTFNGADVGTSSVNVKFVPKAGPVSFKKVDFITGEAVVGAGFTLTSQVDDTVTYTATSTVDGVTFAGVAPGTYDLQESTIPHGYMPNNAIYTVSVNDDGVATINGEPSEEFEVTNIPVVNGYSVILKKLGDDTKPLVGAEFELWFKESPVEEPPVRRLQAEPLEEAPAPLALQSSREQEGQLTDADKPAGEASASNNELENPAGSNEATGLANETSGTAGSTGIENNTLRMPAQLPPQDELLQSQESGAQTPELQSLDSSSSDLTILNAPDSSGTFDPEGYERIGGTWTTDKNGIITIDNLLPGSYYLKEIRPPLGYSIIDDGILPFSIEMIGQDQGDAEPIMLEMINERIDTSITVTKIWDDQGATISHPKITINLLADDAVIDSVELSDGATTHTFDGLPTYNGTNRIQYTVEEVPVPGYIATVDGFSITNTRVVKPVPPVDPPAQPVLKKTPIPKTNDPATVALMGIAGLGLIGMARMTWRRRSSK